MRRVARSETTARVTTGNGGRPALARTLAVLALGTGSLLLPACSRDIPRPEVAAERPVRDLASCELPPDSVRYVVVLDHSGSMRPQWNAVRRQLVAIADSIPDRSWFRVTLFSGRITTGVPDFHVRPDTRAELRMMLGQLPEPEYRAPTDIGMALEEAAEVAEAGAESRRWGATFLFFLTDGRHEAPTTSRFRALTSEPWRALRRRWAGLDQSKAGLYSLVIPIAERSDQTDVRLVGNVAPYSVVLGPTAAGRIGSVIGEQIGRAKRDLLNVRAAREVTTPRLDARLENNLQSAGAFRGTAANAVVRSQAACVTYIVTPTGVNTAEGAGIRTSLIEPDEPLELPPGDSVVLQLRLRAAPSLAALWPWARHAPVSLSSSSAPQLRARIQFEPDRALLRLTVDTRAREVMVPVIGAVQPQRIELFSFGTLMLAGLGVIGLLWQVWRAPQFELRAWGNPLPTLNQRLPRRRRGELELYESLVLEYRRDRLLHRTAATLRLRGSLHDVVVAQHGQDSDGRVVTFVGSMGSEQHEIDLADMKEAVILRSNDHNGFRHGAPLGVDAEHLYSGYQIVPR